MKNVANWLPPAILSPFIIAVALSIIYWVFVLLPKYIRERREVRARIQAARKVEKERIARVKRFEAIKAKLDAQIYPARPRMKPEKKVLYSNPETCTLVYQIFTSNATLPYPVSEYMVWGQFFIGNADGFIESDQWLDSEANITIDGVVEDADAVTIKRDGVMTTYFEIKVAVHDLVFKKAEFKPYPVPKA